MRLTCGGGSPSKPGFPTIGSNRSSPLAFKSFSASGLNAKPIAIAPTASIIAPRTMSLTLGLTFLMGLATVTYK
ncbi:hypothetical protein NIES39_O01900 [Arthrospira platensis NIES-39]|nr:hypothetical protein NIES39_O01900 [Arthrospira platensis NIES-39]